MRSIKYTFWQDGEFFLGYLNEYPDYVTQGNSKEELLENLILRQSKLNQSRVIRK